MNQPSHILPHGTVVRTHPTLESSVGMNVAPCFISRRQANAFGVIQCVAPGHGGDVYMVEHADSAVWAPYCWSEFELDGAPPVETRYDMISKGEIL